jgi:hypothetical protein
MPSVMTPSGFTPIATGNARGRSGSDSNKLTVACHPKAVAPGDLVESRTKRLWPEIELRTGLITGIMGPVQNVGSKKCYTVLIL